MSLQTRDELLKENQPTTGGFWRETNAEDVVITKPLFMTTGGFFMAVFSTGGAPPAPFNAAQFMIMF